MIFKHPQEGMLSIENELFSRLRRYEKPVTPYNLKLEKKGIRYYWKHDSEFDIDHHIRHIALPKPGRIRELLTYLSAEHSNLMHRERPLWECHIIEGIQGNRFAIYFKMHHAMSDGVSALHYLTRFLSNDPNQQSMPPPWAIESAHSLPVDTQATNTGTQNLSENKTIFQTTLQSKLQSTIQMMKVGPSVYRQLVDQKYTDRNTLHSRFGKKMFGLTACRRSMPSIQALLGYIDQSMDSLQNNLCGSHSYKSMVTH